MIYHLANLLKLSHWAWLGISKTTSETKIKTKKQEYLKHLWRFHHQLGKSLWLSTLQISQNTLDASGVYLKCSRRNHLMAISWLSPGNISYFTLSTSSWAEDYVCIRNTTDVWINVSKEGDKIFMSSAGVLNLLHLNTWNTFCMCSRFHVLWNLNTCRTHFMCSNVTDLEHLRNTYIFSPSLETFIQTSVVFSYTNIILNPQRNEQSKTTWFISLA